MSEVRAVVWPTSQRRHFLTQQLSPSILWRGAGKAHLAWQVGGLLLKASIPDPSGGCTGVNTRKPPLSCTHKIRAFYAFDAFYWACVRPNFKKLKNRQTLPLKIGEPSPELKGEVGWTLEESMNPREGWM